MTIKATKRSVEQVEAEGEQAETETRNDESVDQQEDREGSAAKQEDEAKAVKRASKKRKTQSTESVEVKQTPRRTTRNSKTESSSHEPKEIVHFLLSDKALEMLDQLESGKDSDFHFPRDRLESLHRSKTLHKDKTTGQIIGIAEVCKSSFNGSSSLSSLRKQSSHDPGKERDLIVKSFKGYGPKTVDIFFRRVQADWEEVYPFADAATIKAAREVGLDVDDAEGLKKVVDDAIEDNDDEKRRLSFARVVDVLVYLGLEKKTDQAESQIGKA
ncbi:hypothetical protein QFC21_000721 [Naganishia friedmannii]|uniref:Uncharacterized protein n=1 Tax=Naganishia friedmannii TaxID=89922 RepID=A0ACC2W6A7_9TREE|nr:hypothetical protein QFC21_000721 [Naganishia friedmannii]